MKIFISPDEMEIGPYDWVDIAIMLHNRELDESVSARIGNESKSLREWGLWSEGMEGGPFSWDEISRLLEAGVLDLQTKARFASSSKMSNLQEVIRHSREVSLDDIPAPRPRVLAALLGIPEVVLAKPLKTTAVLACLALLLCGIAVLTHRKTPPSQNEVAVQKDALPGPTVPATAGQIPDVPPSPLLPEEPPAAKALASSPPSIPTELPKSEPVLPLSVAQQGSEVAGPVPNVPATPDLAAQAAAAGDTGSSTLVAKGQEPDSTAEPPPPVAKATPSVQKAPPPKIAATPSATPEAIAALVGDFFAIQSVKFLKRAPKDTVGVWRFSEDTKRSIPEEFQPCLEVKVLARNNIRSDKLTAKAYFFDDNNTLLASAPKPSKAGKQTDRKHFEMPVLFYQDKADSIFFEVPEKARDTKWKAVIVFGDQHEAESACFPATESDFLLNYPEKKLVYDRETKRVARKAAMDPLIEHVVRTKNPKLPQMTLFLRPPRNVSDSSEIRGVVALCLLAGSLDDIRRELQKEEMSGDHHGLLAFADKNKLAILAWGANSSLWARANYDELSRQQARKYDASFGIVANAWERGVLELGEKYGMPTKGFLIQGQCGSAHLAKALCLAKPEYFLAIHIHIPGYFEQPTPEASRVLWCVTTGELYYSYDYSLRFLADSKKLGYPILYKAFVGLGHSGHPDATAMGLEFFKFALTQQSLIEEHEKKKSSSLDAFALSSSQQSSGLWLESFKNPPMYGDIINQEVFPADQVEMIPEGFRIPIPTKELGAIWKKNH